MKTVLLLIMSFVTSLANGRASSELPLASSPKTLGAREDGSAPAVSVEGVGTLTTPTPTPTNLSDAEVLASSGDDHDHDHSHEEEGTATPPRPADPAERPRGHDDRTNGRTKVHDGKAGQRIKEGRTEAPMLGYIFDTHAGLNKHHHHDHRWGPHFEEAHVSNSSNMTVHVTHTATLNCRISLLQDKTVAWVRKGSHTEAPTLLTVGLVTYSGDPRYQIHFQYPNNWRLQIESTTKQDEGTYECQISTHPPKVIRINLHINAPEVLIVDEKGKKLQDKYYEVASTIQLTCIVRHVALPSGVVGWLHGERMLNYDVTRGGISVRTELVEGGATSTLSVARINKSDAGDYTCLISTRERATVAIHVLNGESIAELHDGSGCEDPTSLRLAFLCLLIALVLS